MQYMENEESAGRGRVWKIQKAENIEFFVFRKRERDFFYSMAFPPILYFTNPRITLILKHVLATQSNMYYN